MHPTIVNARSRASIELRLFLLIAPILYAAYALLTPPLQSPDEHQHLFRAWQLSEGVIVGERRANASGGMLPGGLSVAAEREIGSAAMHVMNRPMTKREVGQLRHTEASAEPARFTSFFAVLYPPSAYVPQAAAVATARATGASVEVTVLFGRILNAALAITLIALAIRITPWGKSVMLWTGLLPMTAAMSASLGQDGLVIGGTCLLLALALRGGSETRKVPLAASVVLAAAVALSKVVYFPLALVGAGAPRVRANRLSLPLASFLPLMVALLVVAVWQWLVSPLQLPPKPGLPSVGERLGMVAAHPSSFFDPLWLTLSKQAGFYARSNFTFGWLTVGPDFMAMKLTLIALIAVVIAGDPTGASPSLGRRLWLFLLATGSASLIFVAMFLLYTYPTDTFIDGIQGRYFIPVAVVLLLALLPRHALAPRVGLLAPLLMVAANLSALVTIAVTFYRF